MFCEACVLNMLNSTMPCHETCQKGCGAGSTAGGLANPLPRPLLMCTVAFSATSLASLALTPSLSTSGTGTGGLCVKLQGSRHVAR